MNLYEDLTYRGLIKDYSNEEKVKEMLLTPQTIYCGFDPSASSMQMGNFVMIMILMRLQRAGHKIVALVGGATGMIGDPGGKSAERNLLSLDTVMDNTNQIANQLKKYIDFSDPKKGFFLNNYDWLSKINILEFLRDYGKYFPINYLLAKETVASRLEKGISYAEFSYTLLQAVDFLHLYENHGVSIQIGGGDQWGNLITGIDLIKKVHGNTANAEVMTAHLITNSEGKKFGKSEQGALYIDPAKFSPYKLYQYFYNVSDADAIRYLKIFTFLTREEIEEISAKHSEALHLRYAQSILAQQVVTIVHSVKDFKHAKAMSEALFSGDFKTLKKSDIVDLFGDVAIEVFQDTPLEDVLISLKAASSKREAREFINGNSVTLNGEKVTDPLLKVNKTHLIDDAYFILKRGKKLYFVGKIA